MFDYDSFRQARWQHAGRLKPIRLVVIHCTVSKEIGTGAEAVARYFATTDRKGSTHAVADNDTIVGCVKDADTAFGAAGANSDGLHLELVGLPDQTLAQWLDAYSRAEFATAAPLLRYWSTTYNIPLRWLTVDQLRDGKSQGLTTHADVSKAFPEVSTGHWDPGPNFPRSEFLNAALPTPPHQEDPVQLAPLNVATDPPVIAERWYQRWLGRSAAVADVQFVADLLADPAKTYQQALDTWHATAAKDPAYKGR